MFKKRNIKSWPTFNLGGIICLATAVYLIYYLLLKDHLLPLSSSSFSAWGGHHWHILAIALLPVYLALMIFGTAVAGVYLGSAIQRWLVKFLHPEV